MLVSKLYCWTVDFELFFLVIQFDFLSFWEACNRLYGVFLLLTETEDNPDDQRDDDISEEVMNMFKMCQLLCFVLIIFKITLMINK